MKKILALVLSVLMLLAAFCSCAKPNENGEKGTSSAIVSTESKDNSSDSQDNSSKNESDSLSSFPTSSEILANKPSDKVALELFNSSTNRLARAGSDETGAWVYEDLGLTPVDRKLYDREGDLIKEGWTDNGPRLFYKTNGKYADAEAFYAKVFSGKLLEDFMYANFTNYGGTLGIAMGGGATGLYVCDVTLTYKDYVDGVYCYNAKYKHYSDGEFVESTIGIEKTQDGYRVCKNDYLSGPYGWQWRLYKGQPETKFATELFNKSSDYLANFFCMEHYEAVDLDFKIEYELHKFYDADGKLLDDYEYPSYYKTNRKYADAKAHFAKTFTGDLLDEFMKAYYIDLDGTLGVWHIGGASGISFSNVTLEYNGFKDGVHNYTASYYGRELDWEKTPLKCEFAIVLTSDGYRVCKNEYNGGLHY